MNNYQKKNSKYLRDKDEKNTSKYIRSKDDGSNQSKYIREKGDNSNQSKYLRDKSEKRSKYLKDSSFEEKHHYNLTRNIREEEEIIDEELDALEAEELEAAEADELLKDEATEIEPAEEAPQRKSIFELMEEARAQEEAEMEASHHHHDSEQSETAEETAENSNIFKDTSHKKETTVVHIQSESEKRTKALISTVLVMSVLTVIACTLQFATVRFDFFPTMLNVEFSALPELIASLSYGPVFGFLIIVIKNLFHLIVSGKGFYSELSNLVLDTVFISVAGYFYTRRMFAVNPKRSRKPNRRDLRRRRIFEGGMLGTACTAVSSFFLTKHVSFPIIFRQYESRGIDEFFVINNYQEALDKLNKALPDNMGTIITHIDNLNQAILMYNIPIQVIKYLTITLFVSLIYVLISPYLHFRKSGKN